MSWMCRYSENTVPAYLSHGPLSPTLSHSSSLIAPRDGAWVRSNSVPASAAARAVGYERINSASVLASGRSNRTFDTTPVSDQPDSASDSASEPRKSSEDSEGSEVDESDPGWDVNHASECMSEKEVSEGASVNGVAARDTPALVKGVVPRDVST